jgi:hypothetical protein
MTMTIHENKNRHPADELADVRAEMKRLEVHHERLRCELLADGADMMGNEWIASINLKHQARIDAKAAVQHFGAEAMQPFMRRIEYQQIGLRRRKYEVRGRRRERTPAK